MGADLTAGDAEGGVAEYEGLVDRSACSCSYAWNEKIGGRERGRETYSHDVGESHEGSHDTSRDNDTPHRQT